MKILFSDEEIELLDGVSVYAERVYRHLRSRMDGQTRIAGRGAGAISRGMLACNCQYVPPQGSHNKPWKPTLRQVDCLIDELVRAGLVVRSALPSERKKLVLSFPCALVRQKYERNTSVADERNTSVSGESQYWQGVDGFSDCDERRTEGEDERDISMSMDSDVMSTREPFSGDQDPAPDTPVGNAPVESAEWMATLRVFKQQLGVDYHPDVSFFGATQKLRQAVERRTVSTEEIAQAIAVARSKGVGSVAAYASAIIQSGSLVAPSLPVAPARGSGKRPQKVDPVLSYLDKMFQQQEVV
jgi:hypothetical protein